MMTSALGGIVRKSVTMWSRTMTMKDSAKRPDFRGERFCSSSSAARITSGQFVNS
jgi:hypothetical protein